jgi:flagellar hook-associated protein 1 FlgK
MSNSMFYTGLSGLSVAQSSLATTAHNTANVNTPGYSRQTAQIASSGGLSQPSVGFFGTGARTTDVVRSYDRYLSTQLSQAQSLDASLGTHASYMGQLDSLLADQQAGLAPRMQTLFSHVQAVANTPADPAARQQLISSAQALANQFRSMDEYLVNLRGSVNDQVVGSVDEINAFAEQIASLNKQISLMGKVSGTGQLPNDLLDQRDQLVADLSKVIGTRLVVQDGGQYNVFIGNGQSLVMGDRATRLVAVESVTDASSMTVAAINAAGNQVQLPDGLLTGGSLGGVLAFRSEGLATAQNNLGRLAIGIADRFNAQQHLGLDLLGQRGEDFFSQAAPAVLTNSLNKGAATVSASFSNVSALSTSDYALRVTDVAGTLTYTLTRLSDQKTMGSYVAGDFPVTADGLELTLGGGAAVAGDAFLIQPTRSGARDLIVKLDEPADVAAAGPVLTGRGIANVGNAVISAGTASNVYFETLEPLGVTGKVTLTFDSATQEFSGFPDGSTQAYVPGEAVVFNGISFSISGKPANGDTFTLASNVGGVSDGRNALAMGDLQKAKTFGGSASFGDAFAQLVAGVGNKTRQLDIAQTAQGSLAAQIRSAQQSVSGVNQDEETANLLMFQQMYQANAKVIQTASTMFDAVLGIR